MPCSKGYAGDHFQDLGDASLLWSGNEKGGPRGFPGNGRAPNKNCLYRRREVEESLGRVPGWISHLRKGNHTGRHFSQDPPEGEIKEESIVPSPNLKDSIASPSCRDTRNREKGGNQSSSCRARMKGGPQNSGVEKGDAIISNLVCRTSSATRTAKTGGMRGTTWACAGKKYFSGEKWERGWAVQEGSPQWKGGGRLNHRGGGLSAEEKRNVPQVGREPFGELR